MSIKTNRQFKKGDFVCWKDAKDIWRYGEICKSLMQSAIVTVDDTFENNKTVVSYKKLELFDKNKIDNQKEAAHSGITTMTFKNLADLFKNYKKRYEEIVFEDKVYKFQKSLNKIAYRIDIYCNQQERHFIKIHFSGAKPFYVDTFYRASNVIVPAWGKEGMA